MPSMYYILDLTAPNRADLEAVLKSLARQYDQMGGTFMPIFNIDKTKALIQVKSKFRPPRELMRTILGSGDATWASTLGQIPEWQQDLSQDLIDKTLNFLREQTTIDTFIQDVKTAPAPDPKPDVPPDKLPADGK